MLHSIALGNAFLDMTPKTQVTKKKKIDELDLMKIFKFCASEDTVHKVSRQPTEQKKIFANHMSDKGLISRIYREILKLNNNKKYNPIENWTKNLNRHFSKEDTQRTKKHMKR